MASAQNGDTVKVHYTGKLEDGTVFDSSQNREPLEFKIGSQQVINGFEQAVEGMVIGDKKEVKIEAENAYGQHQQELIVSVAKEQFPPDVEPEIGKSVNVQDNQGTQYTMRITGSDEKSVTLDANHPLAGKALSFEIELVGIVS